MLYGVYRDMEQNGSIVAGIAACPDVYTGPEWFVWSSKVKSTVKRDFLFSLCTCKRSILSAAAGLRCNGEEL